MMLPEEADKRIAALKNAGYNVVVQPHSVGPNQVEFFLIVNGTKMRLKDADALLGGTMTIDDIRRQNH